LLVICSFSYRFIIERKNLINLNFEIFTGNKKEVTWDINKVEADSTEAREKCTRRLAQNAKKNAKFLSSQAVTVRYTARTAFQSAKAKAVKSK